MFIEAVFTAFLRLPYDGDMQFVVDKMETLLAQRNWSKISHRFLDTIHPINGVIKAFVAAVRENRALVSEKVCYSVATDNVESMYAFTTTPNSYKFYLGQDNAPRSSSSAEDQDGFILTVTPIQFPDAGRFEITMMKDGYPDDVCFQENLVSFGRMHLVVEEREVVGNDEYDDVWHNMATLSWCGRPVMSNDGRYVTFRGRGFMAPCYRRDGGPRVRMVGYYNVPN